MTAMEQPPLPIKKPKPQRAPAVGEKPVGDAWARWGTRSSRVSRIACLDCVRATAAVYPKRIEPIRTALHVRKLEDAQDEPYCSEHAEPRRRADEKAKADLKRAAQVPAKKSRGVSK